MCELLGISSAKPMEVSGFLKEFYSHSVMHPHGWGLMYHCDGERTILLDSGKIRMDISGEERKNMTPGQLAELFYSRTRRRKSG